MTRIAAVLWSGAIGGAETFTVELCRTMRTLGADPGVVFVARSGPLGARLEALGIPHTSLGLARGYHVARHSRTLAMSVQRLGHDGALLPRGGYLAAALRAGGYRGRVVAVVHDATLELQRKRLRHRILRPIDRAAGFWASDVDVAVSNFVLSRMQRQLRTGRLVRIYNGVDLDAFSGESEDTKTAADKAVTIASAGRLVEGKGIDVLLRAFARGPARDGARLRIAGDGPERAKLERLSTELGLNGSVEFVGWSVDMPAFWRAASVGTLPSDGCVESFGMSAVEAMACMKPVVVTANGALPEVVEDGVTGSVVPRSDVGALATALVELTRDAERRRLAGRLARARCEQAFDIRDCAASYLKLFEASEAGH
ncbi:MAG: glycosyltransferase family 4 protein [Gaiellaceae bacterium]